MSLECAHCHRRSQLYLCGSCQSELRDNLSRLANGDILDNGYKTYQSQSFDNYINQEAYGETRKGHSERRSTERNSPMPINLGASELIERAVDTLHRWAQKITIHQGGC